MPECPRQEDALEDFGVAAAIGKSATEMELFFRIQVIQSRDPPNMRKFRAHYHWDLSSKTWKRGENYLP